MNEPPEITPGVITYGLLATLAVAAVPGLVSATAPMDSPFTNPATVKPLLDDLMECIKIQPENNRPEVRRALIESDVEEVKTLLLLKWRVLSLHLDFSLAAGLSESFGGILEANKLKLNTRTSASSSASSSDAV